MTQGSTRRPLAPELRAAGGGTKRGEGRGQYRQAAGALRAKGPQIDFPVQSGSDLHWSVIIGMWETGPAGVSVYLARLQRVPQIADEALSGGVGSVIHEKFWDQFVTVRCRINSENSIKEVWRSSMNGHAAFAPNPADFIRSLPEIGRIFIRAIAADGQNKDANFKLSDVSNVRDKTGRACNWAHVPDELTGTTSTPPFSSRERPRLHQSDRR